MERKVLKRSLVMLIIFMLVFSNCGFTLQALATSEGISFLGLNLFSSKKMDFNVYFLDDDENAVTTSVTDVNDEMILAVELNSQSEGYLKERNGFICN